jgi:hypothetical protein
MKPKLPRILLWQDLDIPEMKSEPLFEELCEIYKDIINHRHELEPSMRLVFNELYYQSTRLIYENDPDPDLGMLELDVIANVGSVRIAEIVFRLIFCLFTARKDNSKNIVKFSLKIFSYFGMNSEPNGKFSKFINKHQKGVKYYIALTPRPIKVDLLGYQGLYWDKITDNFNIRAIEQIANLWTEEDKVAVIDIIEKAYESYIVYGNLKKSSEDHDDFQSLSSLIKKNFHELKGRVGELDSVAISSKQVAKHKNTLSEQLKEKDKEIEMLKKTNSELRSRIEQLRSNINEGQNETKRERSFTFSRIVEYCNTLPRDERRYITWMLSVFLRDDCNITEEEKKILNDLDSYITPVWAEIVFGNKNVFDGYSQQVAVNSKGQLDIEALIRLLSPEMREQLKKVIDDNG